MDLTQILFAVGGVIGTALIGYMKYLHHALSKHRDLIEEQYNKQETEHLIDLKLKPLYDKTTMLEDRLERLERKIDRILEALNKRPIDN